MSDISSSMLSLTPQYTGTQDSSSPLTKQKNLALRLHSIQMQTFVEKDGNEDGGDSNDDLPQWARRSVFPDDPLMRTHVLLVAFLPTSLLHHLPGPQYRAEFLNAFSSGQSLCLACNTGAAPMTSESTALQEKGRKGRTLRRTDHLRLWSAVERIRCYLPRRRQSSRSHLSLMRVKSHAETTDGKTCWNAHSFVHVAVARHLLITFCPSAPSPRLSSFLALTAIGRLFIMWTTRREWAADPPTTPSISHALAALPAPQCIPSAILRDYPHARNFGGKFAITTDPSVDNGMRAQIFADQLREQGVPISERHSASRTQGTMHVHMLVFPCRCEDGCQGRFLVSVGDNTTRLYGVPG
ncbi:hypothetical protein EDB92DRAFT_2116152, partial [Lactarius akahatsu]